MKYRCPLCGGTLVARVIGPWLQRQFFCCTSARPFDRCPYALGIAWWAETTLGLRLPGGETLARIEP